MDQEEGVYQEDFANGFSHGGIEMDDAETAPESIQEALPAGPAEDGREEKVILTARLELETLEFDRAAPALEDLAEDLAYSWVWVLLAAALVLAAVRILRKRRRTSDARAEKTADDKSGEM